MSAPNLTLEQIVESEEFSNVNDEWEEFADYEVMATFEQCLFPVLVAVGLIVNSAALLIVYRRSLCHRHEAYVYLVTIVLSDGVQLVGVYVPWWLALFHDSYHVAYSSDVVCKFWILLTRLILSSGWLPVAMLASVFVRLRLETTDATAEGDGGTQCRVMRLCKGWCTLRGAVLCVGLLFVACVAVNLWYFVNANVQHLGGDIRLCYAGDVFTTDNRYVKLGLNCFVSYVPVFALTPVLWVAIVVSRSRRFGFRFTRVDSNNSRGETGEGDVDQELGRVTLWLALVLFVLRSPFLLMQILDESHLFHDYRAYFFFYALWLLHPVASALVCFVAVAGFRQEVRSMAVRCWCAAVSGCAPCRRRGRRVSWPVAWNSGSTLVLQLDALHDADGET